MPDYISGDLSGPPNETSFYVRKSSGEEIRSIGGFYRVIEEGVVSAGEREAVYVLTGCELDTSCCCPGGTAEIRVPGFIVSGKSGEVEDATGEIEVERIRSDKDKALVVEALREKYAAFIRIEFE